MSRFLVGSASISRVLSWMIIYLALALPIGSSGYRPTDGQPFMQISLQLAGFTSRLCHHSRL